MQCEPEGVPEAKEKAYTVLGARIKRNQTVRNSLSDKSPAVVSPRAMKPTVGVAVLSWTWRRLPRVPGRGGGVGETVC